MAYRLSDTLKWQDEWFVDLSSTEKLLFMYLCDNCDIAGFFEISLRKIAFDLGIERSQIQGALKGLGRGLILSEDSKILLVKNFIKHQKNLPLNPANKSHQGILKRYRNYSEKFENLRLDNEKGFFDDSPFQGASKGLPRGTGIGIGNSILSITNSSIFSKEELEEKKESFHEKKFEEFWDKYDKKIDKKKAKSAFMKLKKSDVEKLLISVPIYQSKNKDKDYWKHPSTLINSKIWEDEEYDPNKQQVKPLITQKDKDAIEAYYNVR